MPRIVNGFLQTDYFIGGPKGTSCIPPHTGVSPAMFQPSPYGLKGRRGAWVLETQ